MQTAAPEVDVSEAYAALPDELTLREVRVRVTQKGFRTNELVVVTTLLDQEEYPADEIAELYRRRWQAELNLRSLKTVLQMDHLRCKTPHRVRRVFHAPRCVQFDSDVMALAAREAGRRPWQLSFKGALQTVNAFLPMLCSDAASMSGALPSWPHSPRTSSAIALIATNPASKTTRQGIRPDEQATRRLQTTNGQMTYESSSAIHSRPL